MIKIRMRGSEVRKRRVLECDKCGITEDYLYDREPKRCKICGRPAQEQLAAPLVKGAGWFQPGWDMGLGAYCHTASDRDAVMKEKGCHEQTGGGDTGFVPVRKEGVLYSFPKGS